ncbi:MAG: uncharacterized protein QG626_597 [Patescibacteria group bacterium]|jgi:hypothetical protein|nr:uncharacterized protein [Patescibacteria group bacterium]
MRVEFPDFVALTEDHRFDLEIANQGLPPYSDFNFTSLWSWDIKNETRLTYLFDNLVIVMTDYLSGEPCHCFIGRNRVQDTARVLLDHRKSLGLAPVLKLVPEEIAVNIDTDTLSTHEDELNFDYILSIEKLTTYPGSTLKSHRNLITKFSKSFSVEVRVLPIHEADVQFTLISFFEQWVENRRKSPSETINEFIAFQRFFKLAPCPKLVGLGFYVENCLIGFTLNEVLQDDMIMIHFEKANPATYPGAYQVVMQETAKYFHLQGRRYINYQQDLGIPGLKKAKSSFDPHRYLKKYQIMSV